MMKKKEEEEEEDGGLNKCSGNMDRGGRGEKVKERNNEEGV